MLWGETLCETTFRLSQVRGEAHIPTAQRRVSTVRRRQRSNRHLLPREAQYHYCGCGDWRHRVRCRRHQRNVCGAAQAIRESKDVQGRFRGFHPFRERRSRVRDVHRAAARKLAAHAPRAVDAQARDEALACSSASALATAFFGRRTLREARPSKSLPITRPRAIVMRSRTRAQIGPYRSTVQVRCLSETIPLADTFVCAHVWAGTNACHMCPCMRICVYPCTHAPDHTSLCCSF